MPNSRILNLSPDASGPVNADAPQPEGKVTQMGDLIEQAKSDVRRIRTQVERQEDQSELHAKKTKILSMVLAFLIIVLAASSWFVYPSLRDQKRAALDVVGLHNTTGALSEHVQSLEAKFDKAAADFPALSSRMDQLGATMKTALQATRSQAQTAATQVGQRIKTEISESIQAIQSRVAGLESNQRETSGHVNQLEEEIAGLKRQVATMQEQSSAATEKVSAIQQEQQTRAGDMVRLDQKVVTQQTALDSISNQVDRKRTVFELSNRKAEQIGPGIFLAIKRADTRKQEVDGALQFGADSRTLAIRNQGTHQPLVFYTTGETRPFELVFTEVTKSGASGYLVTPTQDIASTSADNIQ